MKKIAFGLLFGLLALSLEAASLEWLTDLAQAQKKAKAEKKMVLLNFTGSNWCVWCKKLKAEVFDTADFGKYAKENLVLMEVDFPRPLRQDDKLRKANQALAQKFRADGFPTVVVLNSQGREVWRQVGYLPGGAKVWIDKLDSAKKR